MLTQKLLGWRQSIESKFVFDPTKGVDPADIAALDRTIAARKAQIERVCRPENALERIRHQITLRRQSLLQQLEAAAKALAREEADLRVL